MAAPTIVGVGDFAGSTGAITPSLPAGLAVGDWMYLNISTAEQAISIVGGGWDEVSASPLSTGTANTAGGLRQTLFRRIYQAGDSAPTTSDSGSYQAGRIIAFRGVDSENAINSSIFTATGSGDAFWPSITTTAADCLIVGFWAGDRDIGTTGTQLGDVATPSLDGGTFTDNYGGFTNAGHGGGVACASGTLATPGTVSDSTYRLSGNNWVNTCIVIALAPASAGGGVTGILDAQETGSDTATITGSTSVTGTLSAQETGSDAADITGSVAVTGVLGAIETGQDGAAAAGGVTVAGALIAQETGQDSAAAVGEVTIVGVLAAQETGSDTFDAIGTVSNGGITGTLSAQETGSDVAALVGSVGVSGVLDAQETGADTATIIGTVGGGITGTLAAQETGSDALTAVGTVSVSGVLGAIETGQDAAVFAGAVGVSGSLSTQETGSDTFAASGSTLALETPMWRVSQSISQDRSSNSLAHPRTSVSVVQNRVSR